MPPRGRARAPLSPDSSPRERALATVALARREGLSLRRAARLARTDPRTVRRYAGQAFRKDGARWRPTPYDRIPREMTLLSSSGPQAVVVRDSRTATRIAEHANAVARYVELGDEDALGRQPRRVIRIRGQPIRLATDPVQIDRLAVGGELHFELYRT